MSKKTNGIHCQIQHITLAIVVGVITQTTTTQIITMVGATTPITIMVGDKMAITTMVGEMTLEKMVGVVIMEIIATIIMGGGILLKRKREMIMDGVKETISRKTMMDGGIISKRKKVMTMDGEGKIIAITIMVGEILFRRKEQMIMDGVMTMDGATAKEHQIMDGTIVGVLRMQKRMMMVGEVRQ
jgi:hypothetical protein